MKNKDLWDMRDLPMPERDPIRQNVKSRDTISLAEWSEKGEFWKEWKDEFQVAAGVPEVVPTTLPPNLLKRTKTTPKYS